MGNSWHAVGVLIKTKLGYFMSASGLPDPWLSHLPFLATALKALLAGGIKHLEPQIPAFSWVPPLSVETITRMSCVACLADPYHLQHAARILAVLTLNCCDILFSTFSHCSWANCLLFCAFGWKTLLPCVYCLTPRLEFLSLLIMTYR